MLIKTLSVAVQTARAIIARDRLTLDTAPFIPFINGLLPVPPPVRLTLPIVHVRYDALTPPPLLHIYPLSRTFLNAIPKTLTTGDSSRVPVVM